MLDRYLSQAAFPIRVARFMRYRAAPSSTKRQGVYHPSSICCGEIDYPSLNDLIRAEFPPPPRGGDVSGSTTASTAAPLPEETDAALHARFDLAKGSIAHAFFNACEPTNSGITNFDENQNSQLNDALRDCGDAILDSNKARRYRVVEVGSGTGRLVPVLGSIFFDAERKALRDATSFEFNEPVDSLRVACQKAVARTFGNSGSNNKIAAVRGDDASSLLLRRIDEKLNKASQSQAEDGSAEVLVMSGVAQYLSDFHFVNLLATAEFGLIQEDVSGLGQPALVFHERDASLVRSDVYFDELFRLAGATVLARRQTVIDGCITHTWALQRQQ